MATKKCANGHLYDPAIYGDKCPFCPSPAGATKVNTEMNDSYGTKVLGGDTSDVSPTVTIGNDGNDAAGGATVVRHVGTNATGETGVGSNRRMVGLLVSYSAVSTGEVYKVYEGRTTIGRNRTCDIPFPNDSHMSGNHLLIQYVEAKGEFRAQEYDKGSANGTYVNGARVALGQRCPIKRGDIIRLADSDFQIV